jgi:hypothetical protein
MYKVLYPPELAEVLPESPRDAHVCLVYEGARKVRALIYSIAHGAKEQQENAEKFELAALLLNSPPSLSVQKQRLRSIVAVWRQSEAARLRRASLQRRSANFRADFGRMDIGLNPGWGRD